MKYARPKNIFLDAVKGLHIIDLSQVENATLIRGDNRTGMAGPTGPVPAIEKTLALIRPVVLILDNRGLLVTGNENDRNIAATAMAAPALARGQAPVRHHPALPPIQRRQGRW